MSAITLNGISKVYRTKEIETTALENVSLTVSKGEFISIMGPSGCGKSTLLNIIGLLDKPTTGTVTLLGQDTSKMSDTAMSHFRNASLGFVFQSFHLIQSLDVAANVELPLIYRNGPGARERRERVEAVLKRLEMTHRIKHMPTQLSGGPVPESSHSPRHSRQPRHHPCRRAHGQPRLEDGRRSDGTASPPQPRGRHNYRHGHPQRGSGPRNRPHNQIF